MTTYTLKSGKTIAADDLFAAARRIELNNAIDEIEELTGIPTYKESRDTLAKEYLYGLASCDEIRRQKKDIAEKILKASWIAGFGNISCLKRFVGVVTPAPETCSFILNGTSQNFYFTESEIRIGIIGKKQCPAVFFYEFLNKQNEKSKTVIKSPCEKYEIYDYDYDKEKRKINFFIE